MKLSFAKCISSVCVAMSVTLVSGPANAISKGLSHWDAFEKICLEPLSEGLAVDTSELELLRELPHQSGITATGYDAKAVSALIIVWRSKAGDVACSLGSKPGTSQLQIYQYLADAVLWQEKALETDYALVEMGGTDVLVNDVVEVAFWPHRGQLTAKATLKGVEGT